MDEQDIKALIARYNNGTATPDERNWLDNWYRAEASRQKLSAEELPQPEQEERLLQGTLKRAGLYQQAPVRRLWPRIIRWMRWNFAFMFRAAGTLSCISMPPVRRLILNS
ncbi:hypothetical protein SAMN05216464_10828 [Mucilaginibacter pineti]|uniref:Uncharacterized protein n=1 Tax=Mucilaginibacter pineti TaxID=1391627 RepID=A0A1G7EI66_9SPHI|nr:hypothetical protein SAMN05216464_10828 [Mucilaginibacter pineti]